jgi:nucleoside-diphosphate-sugar epimerase
MVARKILVVGATGKQGSAFIRAALAANASSGKSGDSDAVPSDANSSAQFDLVALTRNAESAAAKGLASLGDHVNVAAGNLDDPETVRKVFEHEKTKEGGGIWGVYVALAFPGLGADASGEERQGKVSKLSYIVDSCGMS